MNQPPMSPAPPETRKILERARNTWRDEAQSVEKEPTEESLGPHYGGVTIAELYRYGELVLIESRRAAASEGEREATHEQIAAVVKVLGWTEDEDHHGKFWLDATGVWVADYDVPAKLIAALRASGERAGEVTPADIEALEAFAISKCTGHPDCGVPHDAIDRIIGAARVSR